MDITDFVQDIFFFLSQVKSKENNEKIGSSDLSGSLPDKAEALSKVSEAHTLRQGKGQLSSPNRELCLKVSLPNGRVTIT